MRDPEPYAFGLGEQPEDYRNIYEGFNISAPGAARIPAGRFPLAPGVGISRQMPAIRPGQEDRSALERICQCIEERFRNIQLTASRPAWIDPPINSLPIDKWNDDPVDISPPSGTEFTEIFSVTIPDFHKARFAKFGQWLETNELFEQVDWEIAINNQPIAGGFGIDCAGRLYNDFKQQLGTITRPGDVFFIAEGNDTVAVRARFTGGTDDSIGVKARLVGWAFRQKYDVESAGAGAWVAA